MIEIREDTEIVLPNGLIMSYSEDGQWSEYELSFWKSFKELVTLSKVRYQPIEVGNRFYTWDFKVWNCFNRNEIKEVTNVFV